MSAEVRSSWWRPKQVHEALFAVSCRGLARNGNGTVFKMSILFILIISNLVMFCKLLCCSVVASSVSISGGGGGSSSQAEV
jgi:hypothetical protein